MKRLFVVCLGVGLLVRVGSAVVIPVNCNLFFNGSNAVQIAWNCYPGKSYVVQTSTNLAQPWQNAPTTPPTLTTTTNWLSYSFPVIGKAQFFKVVRLDTDGPQVYKTVPFNGAIGVNPQATIQAWLRDDSGVNTNTIALTVGTNAPVSLKDSRLSYVGGVLTYTPGTNEFLGTNGKIMTVALAVADTLGNQTTNFTWSFQLPLSPVVTTNIAFLGGTNPAPCNLTLLSTNGNYFTFSYTGSCCLSNGTQLINTNLYTGYTRTVVSFTDYPASNTVVALTRPTKLAELLQAGTLSSGAFKSLTNSGGGKYRPKDLSPEMDFQLQYAFPLGMVLFSNANFLIETTPDSQFTLDAALQVAANFQWFQLTSFQAQLTGSANFELDVHAHAEASQDLSNSVPLITPIHNIYAAFIGPVPVWVDVQFELNAGYTAHFEATGDLTNGISAAKTVSVGKKWDGTNGWQDIFDNPPVSLTLIGPLWQIQGSADLRAYLQPTVTLLIYSAAGVSADLEPYLELQGSVQLNPYQWDLGLYAGLDSTIGLNLAAWDDKWGELPSTTLHLIPQQMLWHTSGPPSQPTPPQITVQPQSRTACLASTVSFFVEAQGSSPLSYCWYKNGLPLTDDPRVTGSASSSLQIANVQSSDTGVYTVSVGNRDGSINSSSATLTVLTCTPPSGMAFIPAGSFTMGNCMDPSEGYSDELPLHTVYVSAFYMDKYLVTKSQWDTVYQWAIVHGYTFNHAGSGKASTHPVQTIDWYDCVKWCNARSEQEGRVPAYYTDAGLGVRYRTGQAEPYVSWSTGYRLPTEAEWEKAARGGLSEQRFPWGNTISWAQANYYSYWSSGHPDYAYDVNPTAGYDPTFATGGSPYTSPVGYFAANGYGLYDMAGNVWQWCWDWYGLYASGFQSDPRGLASGSHRVYRGGDWGSQADQCRAASRGNNYPTYRDYYLGFRAVLPPGQ